MNSEYHYLVSLLLFSDENRICFKITMNKTTFVPPRLLRQIYPESLFFFWISFPDYTSVSTNRILPSSSMRAAGGNLFSFICCVVGIYASGMHRDPERPSYGQKWIERGWLPGTLQICDQKTRRGLNLLHTDFRSVALSSIFEHFRFRDFYILRLYPIRINDFWNMGHKRDNMWAMLDSQNWCKNWYKTDGTLLFFRIYLYICI